MTRFLASLQPEKHFFSGVLTDKCLPTSLAFIAVHGGMPQGVKNRSHDRANPEGRTDASPIQMEAESMVDDLPVDRHVTLASNGRGPKSHPIDPPSPGLLPSFLPDAFSQICSGMVSHPDSAVWNFA